MVFKRKKRSAPVSKVDVKVSEEEEVEALRAQLNETAPESGSQLSCDGLSFDDFPLSTKTREGLRKANLISPTDIQAAALPHALIGRDILGAAKTGSGKTLAFVIPILERLYMERWGLQDGLAAIIITPTRELALQIFEVLRVVGKKHQLSAGLVTGGKKEFEEEQGRIVSMNILVATPGRLLQHFEQTPGFDASQLLVLVLDEADRILDMGFKQQLDDILEYLPTHRQTLLFSATQTKSVKDLARLSLQDAEYLAVHASHSEATPSRLKQNYIICPLHKKLDALFGFIKTHLKSKMIVFLSSCAQVRFVYECFRGMQPGIPLTALHGKIKQDRRTLIYMDFLRRKSACLFATDIAARGLDFPDVDWVIQVDAPEDAAMYIHRVGRTARYTSGGRALLMLMPGEEKSVCSELEEAGIPLKRLSMNPNKAVAVANRAAAMLVSQPECRHLAKKAFTSYLKSLYLLPRNKGGALGELDVNAFSASLGLAIPPPLPAVMTDPSTSSDVTDPTKKAKNVNRALDKLKKQLKAAKEEKRMKREMLARKRAGDDDGSDSESGSEDDLLVVKKGGESTGESTRETIEGGVELPAAPAKIKKKEKPLKIGTDGESTAARRAGAKRVVFDDEGRSMDPFEKIAAMGTSEGKLDGLDEEVSARVRKAKEAIDSVRKEDDRRERERVREKRLKLKQRLREEKNGEGNGVGAVLASYSEEEDHSGSEEISDESGVSSNDESADSGSDDGSESDEDSDSDDDRKPMAKKRKVSSDELKHQEQLALKLLMAK